MSAFNQWFLSLEPGRQAVLREDKWMLADNAFQAGEESKQAIIDEQKQEIAALQQQLQDLQAQTQTV